MKKNFLFKWVSILGAISLLASTVLPGSWAFAQTTSESTDWDFYALHALPASNGDGEIIENSKANWWNGTYTSADGTYTVTIDETNRTITYSNISLKDPGANDEWRPDWRVWFGARFEHEGQGNKEVKIDQYTMDDGYVWVWLKADTVKQLVTAGTLTKEWNIDASYEGVSVTYNMIVDLSNIEIFDINNSSVIKVENWIITSVNGESTDWDVAVIHALPAKIGDTNITDNDDPINKQSGTYTSADGTYTVAIDETNRTITYSNISLKDPGANDEWRPDWAIWFGARFYHPWAITNNATFEWDPVSTNENYNDARRWITTGSIKKAVESGNLNKEILIPMSRDWNADQTYKMIINLTNIEFQDTDDEWNTITAIKVENWKITVLNWEPVQQSWGSSWGWGNWGGGSSAKESKTNTWTTATTTTWDTTDEPKTDDNQSPLDDGLTQELHDAYDFAHENGVTTMPTAAEANMYGPLTRIAMAKMLSQYAMNVLGQKPANIVVPEFPDVTAELNEEYSNAVTLAYQLGIMWINIQEFRPYDNATRAEFGTALSRMLFSTPDGEEYEWTALYYTNHLKKLLDEKIITNANPNLQELRWYVMIMLMRAAE